jgi:hypothetical protein
MVDIRSGRESRAYDIIRHAGAIYALSMANRSRPDLEVVNTMTRAAKFMRQNYMGPGIRAGQLAVWSKPLNRESPTKDNYAELGGVGLGLVALAAVREVQPKSSPLSDLQALGQFALFLQKEDGSFVHKYRREGGSDARWQSLYYPGEAALGFIAFYEADHDTKWLNAAAKALAYLANTRAGKADVPSDHWALIATGRILPYSDRVRSIISRDQLIQHATQICGSIVREQFRGAEAVGTDGAFDSLGRTTPAATRLEGLLSVLEFLPNGELRDKTEAAVERGIAFLLRAQVKTGPYAGSIPGAVRTGARASSVVRVDYVQHALCALIRYRKSTVETSAH